MGTHFGPILPTPISLTSNMQTTLFWSLVPMLRSCVSYIFYNILPFALVYHSILPNANSSQSMASCQFLFPPLLHPLKLVPVNIVHRPSVIQLIMMPYTLLYHLCHRPNTLVPISVLPHLQSQISSFAAPKPPLPLNSSNHSFAIHLSLRSISFERILPLSNPFSFTVWSHKLFHQLKFPKLIHYITKPLDKSFTSKAPITTALFNHRMLVAPTNISNPYLIKFCQRLFLTPIESPISVWNTLDTFSDTPSHMNILLCSTLRVRSEHFLPPIGVAPLEPTGLNWL